jgi:hypothetical protein
MPAPRSDEEQIMQQSSRRPPTYPTPAYAPTAQQPAKPSSAPTATTATPPRANRPAPATTPQPAYAISARAPIVIRPLWLRLLGVGGILHASSVLLTLVVLAVMSLGGDSRLALVTSTIRNHSAALWTWSLFAFATSFVLGFVLLYNAIGTLSLSPWSRRTNVRWSSVWLALATVALIVNLGAIYPLLKQTSPERFTFARLLMVTWAHIAAGLIWPGLVLFAMKTRRVKDLYARIDSGASAM